MKNAENAKFTPKAGDGIIYDWDNSNGASNHIGMFWKIENGKWKKYFSKKIHTLFIRIMTHCRNNLYQN